MMMMMVWKKTKDHYQNNLKMTNQTKNNLCADKILTWNTQGLKTSKENLSVILKKINPAVICLQETMYKNNKQARINGYQIIHRKRNSGARAAGGVIIGLNNDFNFQKIIISATENIETIAVHVESPINMNIINIYIPPDKKIGKKDIQEVIDQVNKPLIIMGDLNAHNLMWGSTYSNAKGKIIEEITNENNLNVMNDEEITYISNSSGELVIQN